MIVKKWFTLITVTGLTGLVASTTASGCSSDDNTGATAADGGEDSNTKDVKAKDVTSVEEDSGGTGNCPAKDFTYSEKAIEDEAKGAWKPPVQTKGACTDDEIKTFAKNLDSASETTPIDDFAKGLSAGCKACMFSTSTDNNWQLVVAIPGTDKTAGFLNFGACHAIETKKDACGKSYQYNQFCVNSACAECDASSDQQCLQTVWGKDGACAKIDEAVNTDCGDTTDSICGGSAEEHAAIICGSGVVPPTDGGSDAPADVDAQ